MSKVKRKTFAAREDLLSKLAELAEFKGLSLYKFINQIFVSGIRAEELNIRLDEVIDEHIILEQAKYSGFILVLEKLWREVVNEIYNKNEEWTLKKWFDAGQWLAKRSISKGIDFEAFTANLKTFFWNVPEFNATRIGKNVSIRLITPRFSESHANVFSSFFEGMLQAFGYKTIKKHVVAGSIRLTGENQCD